MVAIAPPDGTALSCGSLGRVIEPLVVVGRVEEAAGRVGEPLEDPVREARARREPALVERRLVQRQQALGEVGVVLEHALPDRTAVLPRSAQRAVAASSPSTIVSAAAGRPRPCSAAPRAVDRPRRGPRSPARSRPRAPCRRAPAAAASPGAPAGRATAARTLPARRRHASGSSTVPDPRQDRHALPVAVVGHAVGRRKAGAASRGPRGSRPRAR